MKLQLGEVRSTGAHQIQNGLTYPRVMLFIRRRGWYVQSHLIVGQLYVGYAGIMWSNRFFELDLWIAHERKATA